jgi:hypothetical protein
MKYVKMLSLAAMAATALMAFVGASSASATVLTDKNGAVLPAGTVITSTLEEPPAVLTGGFKNIECNKSSVGGKITNAGSATETVKGTIETLTFEECNCEVVVVSKGTLEVHTENNGTVNNGNGTLTSSGAKVTVNCSTIFGNVHCIYTTNNTHLGTLTGSKNLNGKTATMDITAKIPQEETNFLCAEESVWHAKYVVTNPDYVDVD